MDTWNTWFGLLTTATRAGYSSRAQNEKRCSGGFSACGSRCGWRCVIAPKSSRCSVPRTPQSWMSRAPLTHRTAPGSTGSIPTPPPSGGRQYATAEPYPGASWRWVERIIPRDDRDRAAAVVASGALHPAGALAVNALRIAAWRPRLVTEVDDRTLPHELDLLRTAVNLTKGCYRGQETVAKVLNLGRPPRRLVMLHLDGSDSVLPSAGAEVVAPRQRPEPEPGEPVDLIEVGRITTSGYHHELGPIALAVVKRQVPIELVLQASVGEGRISATQTEIVPVTAGSAVTVPRLPRLGVRR